MGTCKKCGASIREGGAFCPNCGAAVEPLATIESSPQEFTFTKGKMIGNLTYKRTTTKVTLAGDQVTMVQTLNRIFRSEKNEKKSFLSSSVASIRSHTVLDFWDTLYAVVFVVLGFFQPLLFLLALICFWCGYGKEMEMSLASGEKVKIPYAGAKETANKLMDAFSRQN